MGQDVNGVFEGGGAKGVAYVGALRAVRQAELTFTGVAGSSAGAITATLVACGCDWSRVESLMTEALASFGGRLRAALSFHRRSVLSSRRLRSWLARSIDGELGGTGRDWTFAELHERTQVALYIVTTDLGSRQPIVFSHATTPAASVADAVVASCAIPVVFPARRMLIGEEVHRLADGGVWANYPSFVFLDDDFRSYHDLPGAEAARRTVGFVLDEGPPDDRERRRAELRSVRSVAGAPLASDRGAAGRELGLVGGLLTSPLTRLLLVVVPLLVLAVGLQKMHAGLRELGDLPVLQDTAVVPMFALLSVAIVLPLAAIVVTLRLGAALLDEGAVGVTAAMGVGPTVPYWVGNRPPGDDLRTSRHAVVRVPVPPSLGTLSFRDRRGRHETAIRDAHVATARALEAWGFTAPGTAAATAPAGPAPAGRARRLPDRVRHALLAVAYVAYLPVATVVAGRLAFTGFARAQDRRIAAGSVAGLLVIVLVGLLLHGHRRHRRALVPSFLVRVPAALLVLGVLGGLAAGVAGLAASAWPSGGATWVDQWLSVGHSGTVVYNQPVDGGFEVTVDVPPAQAAGFEPNASTDDTYEACSGTCWRLLSREARDPGSEVTLWYVPRSHATLWEEDLTIWDAGSGRTSFLLFALAVPCLVFSQRCAVAVLQRRRDRRLPRPGPPAPAPAAAELVDAVASARGPG